MIDDFKDFSKFFTKADEIEEKLYGHSDQLDFPGPDPQPSFPVPLPPSLFQ